MDYPVITPGHLSEFIKALRKTRGLTQASLGALLGLKQVRIAEIESNPGAVSLGQIHLILSALGAKMVLRDTGAGWTTPTTSRQAAPPVQAPATTPTGASTKVSKQAASRKTVAVAPAIKVPLKRRGSW
jgi:HTH-type transcriptional regulator / antitoxin HipB